MRMMGLGYSPSPRCKNPNKPQIKTCLHVLEPVCFPATGAILFKLNSPQIGASNGLLCCALNGKCTFKCFVNDHAFAINECIIKRRCKVNSRKHIKTLIHSFCPASISQVSVMHLIAPVSFGYGHETAVESHWWKIIPEGDNSESRGLSEGRDRAVINPTPPQ